MANVLINEATMSSIADAIREKTSSTDKMLPEAFPSAIESIEGTRYLIYLDDKNDSELNYINDGTGIEDNKFIFLTTEVFQSCYKLKTVTFSNCNYIGDYAFSGCFRLTTASFPNCSYIGDNAFDGCYNLSSIYLTNSSILCSLPYSNGLYGIPIYSLSGKIYVHPNMLQSYKTATNWTYFSNIIKAYSE